MLLTARECAGQAVFKGFRGGEPHRCQQFAGALTGLGAVGQAVDQQGIGNRLTHHHLGVEAGQRVLKHHLNATPGLAQGSPPQAEQACALQPHRAAPHRRQTHQGAAEGAFAAAGSSHQADGFALLQAQADAIHRLEPAGLPGQGWQWMPAAQLLDFQQQRCWRRRQTFGALPLPCLGHQPLGQGGAGGQQQLPGWRLFHQVSLIQHGDLVAPAARHGQVVADQQ